MLHASHLYGSGTALARSAAFARGTALTKGAALARGAALAQGAGSPTADTGMAPGMLGNMLLGTGVLIAVLVAVVVASWIVWRRSEREREEWDSR